MLARPVVALLAILSALAGCVNTPEGALTTASTDDAAAAMGPAPATEEVAGNIQLSVATPARTINNGGAFSTVIELGDNVTGFILELEWDAATPASESLSMWVRPAGAGTLAVPPDPASVTSTAGPLAQIDGGSPLRLALPADSFPEPGEYDVVVRASAQPAGVAANQPFTLHVTSFLDVPFDDAFTAQA